MVWEGLWNVQRTAGIEKQFFRYVHDVTSDPEHTFPWLKLKEMHTLMINTSSFNRR
jgi:hypothetical protein